KDFNPEFCMSARFPAIATAVTGVFTLWLAPSQSQAAGLPGATTLGATNITSSSVRVFGQVSPNGAATSAYYEVGTTKSYGLSTSTLAAGSGTLTVTGIASFGGLFPGTIYHYRVVAFNLFGTNFGLDATFTTLAGVPI